MEVSALKYTGGIVLHGRPALLRLQSDERLIVYLRKGNAAAFEVLVARYEMRLMAFCRHLLGSREDAEDVFQEVMTAAFNAIVADERAINVRPWLYRIARNRSLNHLRRARAIGVDSMDTHFSENGASTADKVHEREEFRLLVGDIHELPETQKTALVLREMDALSYEQISEAMETTVPSVKSLLVRARVSLAEAAEARLLSCAEVRIELGEIAEGLRRRPSPLVRRHLRSCERCSFFRTQLKHTNKALAALMPIGPMIILKKLAIFHLGPSAAGGSGATAAGSGAAGAAVAGGGALAGSSITATSGFMSAGLGALATKAAAGLAAAAIVTAGAVEANHNVVGHVHHAAVATVQVQPAAAAPPQQTSVQPVDSHAERRSSENAPATQPQPSAASKDRKPGAKTAGAGANTHATATAKTGKDIATATTPVNTKASPTGRNATQTDPTVLPTPTQSASPSPSSSPAPNSASGAPTSTTDPSSPPPASGQPSSSSPSPSGSPTGPVAPVGTTPTPAPPAAPVTTVTPVAGTPTPPPPVSTPTPPPTTTPSPTSAPAPGMITPSSGSWGNTPTLRSWAYRIAHPTRHAFWGPRAGA